jgi:hypothetical protein
MRRSITIRSLMFVLLALLLAGCNLEADRSDKPGPDWSRGLRLGRASLRQPVALAVDDSGGSHLAWVGDTLYYAHLDAEAHVLRNEALAVETPLPRQPQLVCDGEGRIHLAWLSRQGDVQRLYHRVLYPAEAAAPNLLLSQEDEDVSSYTMYRTADGDVAFVWESERTSGEQALVHVRLDAPAERATLATEGLDPFAVVDGAGTVHVAWLRQRGLTAYDVFYATLAESDSGAQLVPAGGLKLTDFEVAEGALTYGPVIGLDTGTVYVMWAVQNLGGGLTPTAAFSYYLAFPIGSPTPAHGATVGLPPTTQPIYDAHQGPYHLTQLEPLSSMDASSSSDLISAPAVAPTQLGELAVAFSLMTESEATREIQIATAVFSAGEPVGYQLASKTPNASLMPSLAVGAQDRLHLAWIDTAGFGDYDVYYASAAPDARAWLDRTTREDVVQGAAHVLFGVLSGVGLLPIAGVWSFPAVVFVVVFFIITGQEDMDRRATRIGLGAAVLIDVGMKVLFMPGLFASTPFLQQVPGRWAVPLGILALALLAVYLYVRRAQRATIFKAILLYVAVDVGLTLLLYAPGFFGGA